MTNTSVSAFQTNAPPPAKPSKIKIERIASGLAHPWGLQFLPDGRLLVSERSGSLRLVTRSGDVGPPLSGGPQVVAREQGGLLDLLLAQDFPSSQILYFSYVSLNEKGEARTTVGTGHLSLDSNKGGSLKNIKDIFWQNPAALSWHHFGSRLAWGRKGTLFITTGDRLILRAEAQNPKNTIGKVVEIRTDGKPASTKPAHENWDPNLWSIGHRNIQGAALDPKSGELWTVEHGPKGGDELNKVLRGKNYGWPRITYGREYSGEPIGEGTHQDGLEQPIYYWTPSIATSSLLFYTGDLFPEWKGNIFVGALNGKKIARLCLSEGVVLEEESLLTEEHLRIRTVAEGPDGALWVLTDDPTDGQILRLSPQENK